MLSEYALCCYAVLYVLFTAKDLYCSNDYDLLFRPVYIHVPSDNFAILVILVLREEHSCIYALSNSLFHLFHPARNVSSNNTYKNVWDCGRFEYFRRFLINRPMMLQMISS